MQESLNLEDFLPSSSQYILTNCVVFKNLSQYLKANMRFTINTTLSILVLTATVSASLHGHPQLGARDPRAVEYIYERDAYASPDFDGISIDGGGRGRGRGRGRTGGKRPTKPKKPHPSSSDASAGVGAPPTAVPVPLPPPPKGGDMRLAGRMVKGWEGYKRAVALDTFHDDE
ncbi:hypothetical protein MMC17_008129 [Xylographa soralifera]|nr:hypothetical protein [Xylographa soralifera]